MGCGQSKIDQIYPRKRKRRGCNKSSAVDAEGEEEADDTDKTSSVHGEDDEEAHKKAAAKLRQVSSGPLSAQPETSSSQMDFFKMLDEKIEQGPDYDAASEEEVAYERARLSSLLRDWESASCTRSLPATPGPRRLQQQPPLSLQKHYYRPQQQQLQQQQLQQHQQLQQQQYQLNGDVYNQQHYYHPQFAQQPQQLQQQQLQQLQQQQQYQHNIRGQFFMPQVYQYPRVYSQMEPKSFPPVPLPPPAATSVVQYRKSRGVYTELA